ncbi:MAG: hypothetical protein QF570_02340 [Myxococcota bacterium]|nr:hypothetical protein [Myxococcota bacterium]
MAGRVVAWMVVVLVAFATLSGCAGRGTPANALVSGVDPGDRELALELQAIDEEIEFLETWLAGYPGRFESRRERMQVATRWRAAVERAVVLLNVDLQHPELFARVGELYRQGHNLDVPDAAGSAYNTLNRCLALARDHVGCHFSLARLFLASPPQYAARAEQHLERIRSLVEPDSRPDVEAALAQAYFVQGRRSAALRQVDHYLTLEPDDAEAKRFRKELLIEVQSGR